MKPTLEQLQEFTENELSQAVFESLYPHFDLVVTEKGVSYGVDERDQEIQFDINNWSDMGALANKHKIGSTYNSKYDIWRATTETGPMVFAEHKNELRAKAIVFLLMEI